MKKRYMKPIVGVLDVDFQTPILSTSRPSYQIKYSGTDAEALTKKSSWDSSQWQ
ncbi:MAG: hypothetical protein J6R91_01760 [Bacteroidaceae bacterium]|nr:hypothetical protein [Bacteroidaceae bacterium]